MSISPFPRRYWQCCGGNAFGTLDFTHLGRWEEPWVSNCHEKLCGHVFCNDCVVHSIEKVSTEDLILDWNAIPTVFEGKSQDDSQDESRYESQMVNEHQSLQAVKEKKVPEKAKKAITLKSKAVGKSGGKGVGKAGKGASQATSNNKSTKRNSKGKSDKTGAGVKKLVRTKQKK